MRFWDSSALVPLVLKETTSTSMRNILTQDPAMVAWWGTRVEAVSALARVHREGSISAQGLQKARTKVHNLLRAAFIVEPSDHLADRAERLLSNYELRAGDALQLAAALIGTQQHPQGFDIVSLDRRLREAAGREGFTVLPATV